MKFLYPFFNKVTHTLTDSSINSIEYPSSDSFNSIKDYNILNNIRVAVVRENIGLLSEWALVKIIDSSVQSAEYYQREVYVPQKNLKNIGGKETYKPIVGFENDIDPNELEINPNLKETFLPYIDKKNGFYSVRIQIDNERILDNFLFQKVLEEVFYEGINILLASRGLKSDNDTIKNLEEKYYTFGFINNDFDITINRNCEPLTFTVSIPLNFFNVGNAAISSEKINIGLATNFITFTNNNIKTRLNLLLDVFSSRAGDILALTYPDKIIENFLIDIEINNIRNFLIGLVEIIANVDQKYRISSTSEIKYTLGLDDDLNLVFIKALINNEEFLFPLGAVSAARLNGKFNSKRIFNYLINFNSIMLNSNLEISKFIENYVKYPDATLADATFLIRNEIVDNETIKEFQQVRSRASEACIKLSDLKKFESDLLIASDNRYHLFFQQQLAEEKEKPKDVLTQFKEIKELLQIDLKKDKEQIKILNKEANKDYKIETRIEKKTKRVPEEIRYKDIEGEEVTIKVPGGIITEEETILVSESNSQAGDAAMIEALELNREIVDIERQIEQLKQIIATEEDAQFKAEQERRLKGFEQGLKQAELALEQKYQSRNSAIDPLIYVLGRININKVLFEQIFCLLKNLDSTEPETRRLLASIPPDIVKYFIFVYRNRGLNGANFARALLQGLPFDVNLFCSQNKSTVYLIKGILSALKFPKLIQQLGSITNDIKLSTEIKPTPDAYAAFSRALLTGVEKAATDLIFDIINDLLDFSCEEDLFNPDANNFGDAFNTHFPVDGFQGSTNNNQIILNNNRRNTLNNIFSKEIQLQYGFDVEYQVDLIQKLINDIRCILTPAESLDLLQGNPTNLVITLITNIIKNKYSRDPNNLSFLLTDKDKLSLFFRRLGLTVDPKYIEQITPIVFNPQSVSDLCSTEQLKAREQLLKNKIPQNLGVLEAQIVTRTRKARKLLDTIQNSSGPIEVLINPFCDDLDLDESKEHLIQNYYDHTRQLFSEALDSFTLEARNIPTPFIEKEVLYRGNSGVDYEVYYSMLLDNFNKNLFLFTTGNLNFNVEVYNYKPEFKDLDKIANSLLPERGRPGYVYPADEEANDIKFSCDVIKETPDLLQAFIDSDQIFYETIELDRLFEDKGDSGGIYDLRNDASSNSVAGFMNRKKIFIGITVDIDRGSFFGLAENKDRIEFKLIHNDPDLSSPKILENYFFEGEIKIGDDDGDSEELSEFLQRAEGVGTRAEFDFDKPSTGVYSDVYILNRTVWNRLPVKYHFLINNIFIQYFLPRIKEIEKFDELKEEIQRFQKLGYFSVSDLYNKNNGTAEEKLFITRGLKKDGGENAVGGNSDQITLVPELIFSIKKQNLPKITDEAITILPRVRGDFIGIIRSLIQKNYCKTAIDLREDFIIFNEKNEILPDGNLSSEENKVISNPESSSRKKNILRYSLLDFPKDERYYACNLSPHYLNLEYFLKNSFTNAAIDICKNGVPGLLEGMIKEVLVNLTFRTYVTDLLIKAAPLLSSLTREEAYELYKNDNIVEIIKNYMIFDLQIFGGVDSNNSSLNVKYFSSAAKDIYEKYKIDDKLLNREFQKNNPTDDPYIPFIRREIRHFAKYAIKKGVIKFWEPTDRIPSIYKNFKTGARSDVDEISAYFLPGYGKGKQIRGEIQGKEYDGLAAYVDLLFEKMFIYFIAAQTVDVVKRSIFYKTKTTLAEILFSTARSENERNESNLEDNVQLEGIKKEQEDIIKFMSNVATAPNLAVMVALKPDYSKYLAYAALQLLYTTRNTTLSIAEFNDPNIFLTRRINNKISLIQNFTWAAIPEEERRKLITGNATSDEKLLYKRLEQGKSVIPDYIVSLGVTATKGLFPNLLGTSYLILDTIAEGIWALKTIQELNAETFVDLESEDPCKERPEEKTREIIIECSADQKILLKKELDSFEEL